MRIGVSAKRPGLAGRRHPTTDKDGCVPVLGALSQERQVEKPH